MDIDKNVIAFLLKEIEKKDNDKNGDEQVWRWGEWEMGRYEDEEMERWDE